MTKMIIVVFFMPNTGLLNSNCYYILRGNTSLIKLIEKMDKPNRETTIM